MAELVIKLVNGELAGKTTQEITKNVNAAALAVKKAEIGTEAWVKANQKLEAAKKLQGDLKKQIEGTTSASDMLKKAWNNLPGAGYFNQVGDSFGMMKKGVGGLVSQFGLLKTAIAATGIGLLVLAVVSLISVFKNFTPVIDNVEQVLGGLKAVVDEVINRWVNFATGYLKFITGDFKEGMKQMTESFTGLGESIKGAYNAGVALAELQQDLDDRNRGIAISNAEAERSIERLIIQSKNRTKSEQERLAMLVKAEQVAKAQFETENKLVEDNYRLSLEKAKLKTKLSEDEILQLAAGTLSQEIEYAKRGNLDDELLQEIANNRVKVINLEGKTNNLLEKINNQRDKLREAQEKEEEKRAAARAKRQDEENKAREKAAQDELNAARNIEDLKNSLIEDAQQREIEQIWTQTKRKIEALVGSEAQIAEQKALLQEQEIVTIQAVIDKYAKEAAEKKRAELEKKSAIEKKASDDAVENAKREAAEKEAVEQAYRDFTSQSLAQLISYLGEDEEARKENASAIKKFTKAKILVDLQSEIAGLNASPGSTFTLGAAGAVKAGLAIIRAGLAIRNVNKQEFAKGGYVSGPSHSQGGIPGVVGKQRKPIEFEGGEFFFSRKAVNAIGVDRLTQLNNKYTFATGGPVNPFESTVSGASGGSSATASNSSGDISALKSELRAEREAMMAYVDKRITNIKVNNNPLETQSKVDEIKQIENEVNV